MTVAYDMHWKCNGGGGGNKKNGHSTNIEWASSTGREERPVGHMTHGTAFEEQKLVSCLLATQGRIKNKRHTGYLKDT